MPLTRQDTVKKWVIAIFRIVDVGKMNAEGPMKVAASSTPSHLTSKMNRTGGIDTNRRQQLRLCVGSAQSQLEIAQELLCRRDSASMRTLLRRSIMMAAQELEEMLKQDDWESNESNGSAC
jgi:hypothetical protein